MSQWRWIWVVMGAVIPTAWGLEGRLLEKGTRRPLDSANVFALPEKKKAVTDSRGEFRFDPLQEERCTLVVNVTGYEKLERELPCGETQPVLLYLEKTSYTSFETTVTGKVQKRDDQIQTLRQEDFLTAPGSFGGDPVRAAQNLPGVAQNGASAQVIVQGAAPQDTGYLINGHRVPLLFHFGGLSSVVIPEAVDRVDLIPAGYGPEYSKAQGGIIELTTQKPKSERTQGFAFVDLLNTGALIQGPLDEKSSLLVAGRYSYIGQVLQRVAANSDNFALTAAPTYYDFTSIYQRELSPRTDLKATFILSQDELGLIRNRADDSDPTLRGNFSFKTGFFRLIPQIDTRLDENSAMSHSIGVGRDEIFVDANSRFLNIRSNVLSHRSEYSRSWHPVYKSFLGLDNQMSQADVQFNLPNSFQLGGIRTPFAVGDERKARVQTTTYELGGYLRQEIKPGSDSNWLFSPNVRTDYFTLNKSLMVQPRISTKYNFSPTLYVRASGGLYAQPPQPQEASSLFGNPNLRSPNSTHHTLGWAKDFRDGGKDGFQILNNFFYKELRDIVVPDVRQNFTNDGSGKIKGGEIQAKYRSGRWSGQLVYTYLDSERTIPGIGTYRSEFDQTHNLNLMGGLNLARWTFGARYRFVTGNPYTPVASASFDMDNDVYIPRRGPLFSERFSNFSQLDLRVDRKFVYDTWILSAYFDVQNVLNSANPQDIEYSYDFSQKQEARGLPILPTFGLKGEF